MARIELQINADTPDELQEILAGLVGGSVQPETTGVSAEAPGKRRGRPPGSKNKPDDAPPAPVETKAPEAPAAPAPAPEAPAAAAPPAETPESNEPTGPTSDDVRHALKLVIDKFGENGAKEAKAILEAVGAKNITALPAEKYAEVIDAATAKLKATTDMLD